MAKCYFCGAVIKPPVYRGSECPQCGKDVRICLNCAFYSPGSHWDCHETIPEAVRDKERANFCDYFKLRANNAGDGVERDDAAHRRAFEDLFGEK